MAELFSCPNCFDLSSFADTKTGDPLMCILNCNGEGVTAEQHDTFMREYGEKRKKPDGSFHMFGAA
jgi:hypothetical protein